MIAVLVAIAFSASPVSAVASNLNGYGSFEDGSQALFDSLRIINTNTSTEWNQSTTPAVVLMGGGQKYRLALDDPNDVVPGNIMQYIATNGTWTNTSLATYTGLDFQYNITFNRTLPDLIVEEITTNCGFIHANQSNTLSAKIKNNGTGNAAAFNVSFEAGTFYDEVRVDTGLLAGANVTVSVTDPTIRNACDNVMINVTADCNGAVPEGVNENNNASNLTKQVVNNGYKGKSYTGGENITTWKTFNLTEGGDVLYSTGDSKYMSGSGGWTHMNVTWDNMTDLPFPNPMTTDADIEAARLYVPYTYAKRDAMPNNYSMVFNNDSVMWEEHYWDDKTREPCGTNYAYYGMLVYNVTNFHVSGNTANFTSLWSGLPGHSGASMRGMVLVVVYKDDEEMERKIIINEEFDMLYGGTPTYKCTTPAEATAYAHFPPTDPKYTLGRLITLAPGAGPNEGNLILNPTWYDVWNFMPPTQIGVDERDVSSYLSSTNNLVVGIQSDADWMEASNAILVLTKPNAVISVEPERKLTPPQKQFDVNITLVPPSTGAFGVQYTLKYDNRVLKAESQVPRDFFKDNDTIVVRNEIDQADGLIHYAVTLRNDTNAPCEHSTGTLTTIQFTAIGEPGATSTLNFSKVIVIDCTKDDISTTLNNGTVDIFDYTAHVPNITCANSTHEKNNVQKKFECWTELAVNITDGGEEGYNITYVRWSFGDGQYGTAEGGLPCNPTQETCCIHKNHSYIMWDYNPDCDSPMPRPDHNNDTHEVCYYPLNASVTVTDDGVIPQETTKFFDVWVFLTGDANGDAKVNILDAVWIGKHFNDECDGPAATGATHCAGNCGYMWSSNQKSGADLNNDCTINILDAVIVGTMWGHTAY